jgi:hypothetical protein
VKKWERHFPYSLIVLLLNLARFRTIDHGPTPEGFNSSAQLSPVHKHEVHREMVGEKDIHEEHCSQVEEYTQRENYQARAPEEDRKRERKVPQEHQRDENRRVLADVREPEGQPKVSVMQIVERMNNDKAWQVVRAQVTQPGDAKLEQGRAEVGPCEQGAHQKNRIAVNDPRRPRPLLTSPTVARERVAARTKSQNDEDIDRRHLVVIEVAEAAQ